MNQHVFIQFESVIPASPHHLFFLFLSFLYQLVSTMLRMYSVMQLQQVWSNKPEAQEDVLPPTSPVNDVLPAVQEEAAEDDNDAAAAGTSMCIQ